MEEIILTITSIIIGYAIAYSIYVPRIKNLNRKRFNDDITISNYITSLHERILTLKDKLKNK